MSGLVRGNGREEPEPSIDLECRPSLAVPFLQHQPVNLSATEPARAIVVRNDPNEQEHVVLHEVRGGEPKQR